MGQKTGIAWTDHTFNIAWGCVKVSPGCKHCYAETLSNRLGGNVWGPGRRRRVFGRNHWEEPRRWNRAAERAGKRSKVFTSSMCDVFEDHSDIDRERERLWFLIRETPWLDWQVLTKRIERVADRLPKNWGDGWPNVWLGTSIENNAYAFRAEILSNIPAVVRFVSYEPALGPLELDLSRIDWLIYGGESGPHYRHDDASWAGGIMEQCRESDTAFFYKQNSGRKPGITLSENVPREWPVVRS